MEKLSNQTVRSELSISVSQYRKLQAEQKRTRRTTKNGEPTIKLGECSQDERPPQPHDSLQKNEYRLPNPENYILGGISMAATTGHPENQTPATNNRQGVVEIDV